MKNAEVTVLREVHIPGGRIADLTLTAGIITHIGSSGKADTTIRCSDCITIPAGIDMHVHMRDGIQSAKEDWRTGTQSAIAGGVTVVIDQPNTIPPVTTTEVFQERVTHASKHTCCHFGINAGVTPDADLDGMAVAGAMAFGETFAGPSSYGVALSEEALRSAISEIGDLGGLLTVHAEMVRDGEDIDLGIHDQLRPAAGETEVVRMIEEIRHPRCMIHYCHISSPETLRTIKQSRTGTAEVTPHHLFLSHELFDLTDTVAKVNPPLRSEQMRRELYRLWKEVDVIASDHAPHTQKEKNEPFIHAPSGIAGVQTMIPLLMAEVLAGRFELPDVIQKTSVNPARILGIPPAGYGSGMRADFALYPDKTSTIHGDTLFSKAGLTPFEGMGAVFPSIVIMGGDVVYNNGDFSQGSPEWIQGRGFIHGP